MNIYIANKILVKDYDNYIMAYCKNNLEFDNPDFIKKERMGKWTGNTQRQLILYEKIGNDIVLPFGCLKSIWKDLKNTDTKFISLIKQNDFKIDYKSQIKLYQYQENVVNKSIKAKNGVIVMPCGSGKTQTALEIVARLGKKTLWLTHTQDLLNQSMNRAKTCFNLDASQYGTITEGKVNIGNAITFATVQTMCNIDLKSIKKYFDVIIVDECHKCVGTPTNMMMFYKVLSGLSARYKYGLTATPKRADGLEKCMFAILGDVIYEVPKNAVENTTCPVEVKKIYTDFIPDTDVILAGDGTLIYSSLIDNIIKDTKRNEKIIQDLRQLDGATLILSDRVQHLEILNKMLDCDKSSIIKANNTKTEKEARKTKLNDLNSGKLKYLFATYKLAKEGLDIPNLRYVVFATPQKDETTVVQSAGRVGRKYEGKEKGVVIDYVDNFGMLLGYSKKRDRFYKKLGYSLYNM